MKNKATGLLKQVISALTSMVRTKTLALKGKTNAFRTRLIIFSLLRNKKILMPTSISQKLHALMGHRHKQSEQGQAKEDVVDQSKSPIVLYNHSNMSVPTNPTRAQYMKNITEDNDKDSNFIYSYGKEDDHDHDQEEEEEEEEKYPDLKRSLFELSNDSGYEDPGGSVTEMVKNSKEEAGEEFKLEDEIDQVADLFIRRFHRQMRLQKQLSLKRHHQEKLQRDGG